MECSVVIMKIWTEPYVKLIGKTEFIDPKVWEFPTTDSKDGAELLSEYAGRCCYLSFGSKRGRKTNSDYIRHILEMRHGSVLEHNSYAFLVQGISRAASHELVRHRHLSYSQLSQRYVSHEEADLVIHPEFLRNLDQIGKDFVTYELEREYSDVLIWYEELTSRFESLYKDVKFEGVDEEESKRMRRKMARQAARMVLPNMTETKMVVSGNARAWRTFIDRRATLGADLEIRCLAIKILQILKEVSPNIFGDYEIKPSPDGTAIAETQFRDV